MVRRSLAIGSAMLALAACKQKGGVSGFGAMKIDAPPPVLRALFVDPLVPQQMPLERVNLLDPRTGTLQQDMYTQSDGRVDVLFVVDDSGSMADKRARLADNFDKFFSTLQTMKVDYQVGVTSTDLLPGSDDGKLRGTPAIITNTTPNAQDVFRAAVTFPQSYVSLDQGLDASYVALSPSMTGAGGPNAGFVRPGAALGVVVVTDGRDKSFGDPAFYARWYRGLKGAGNEPLLTFSAIAGDVPDGCTPAGEQNWVNAHAEPGTRYKDVVDVVGGTFGSICDQDFTASLISIAQGTVTLKRNFPLSLTPLPGTLSVFVDGARIAQDDAAGWHYDALTDTVQFLGSYLPPPRSQVRLVYVIKK